MQNSLTNNPLDSTPGPRATVLGSGSWGSALAQQLAAAGAAVRLWGRDEAVSKEISAHRTNQRYLPGVELSEQVESCTDLAYALKGAELVVFALPSFAVRAVARDLAAFLSPSAIVVSTAKGLEAETLLPMSEVLAAEIGGAERIAVLAGPSFAIEVAKGLPTCVTVAARQEAVAKKAAAAFHFARFRVYTSTDIVGVELGGPVKNVIALAAGLVDGVGMGSNARAALLTRGLAEMRRLIIALGGEAETVTGLSGLGDLLATATSDLSRNRQVGLRLGRGEELPTIVASLGHVAEAVSTSRRLRQLAEQHGLSVPIVEQVDLILSGQTTVEEAVAALLAREQKAEN